MIGPGEYPCIQNLLVFLDCLKCKVKTFQKFRKRSNVKYSSPISAMFLFWINYLSVTYGVYISAEVFIYISYHLKWMFLELTKACYTNYLCGSAFDLHGPAVNA